MNGDPVTQKQFYEGQKEVLVAVEKVNGNVNNLRVDMKGFETKQEIMEKEVGRLQSWRNGLATVEALLGAVAVWLGLRD